MNKYFHFGEQVAGYSVPVLNEREARAAAGLLFAAGLMMFVFSYQFMDFRYSKIYITFFMIDFFIRVVLNPLYAPSLIAGRFFVFRQAPEYVGAAQKRFAWSIGLMLSIVMFYIVVILEMMTPIKVYICITCLVLMFSETAFGICLGCVLYNLITKKKAMYCPGNTCEVRQKEPIQHINLVQWVILLTALGILIVLTYQAALLPR